MRLGRNEKVDLIRGVPLFTHCSRAELAEVAKIADEIDVREGKELTREGDRGREFFVLLEGNATVKQGSRKVNTLGPGDFFGEIALVQHGRRTATVVCSAPSTLAVMSPQGFDAIRRELPRIAERIESAITERLAR